MEFRAHQVLNLTVKMKMTKMSFYCALVMLRVSHPKANPNKGFTKQLIQYENSFSPCIHIRKFKKIGFCSQIKEIKFQKNTMKRLSLFIINQIAKF